MWEHRTKPCLRVRVKRIFCEWKLALTKKAWKYRWEPSARCWFLWFMMPSGPRMEQTLNSVNGCHTVMGLIFHPTPKQSRAKRVGAAWRHLNGDDEECWSVCHGANCLGGEPIIDFRVPAVRRNYVKTGATVFHHSPSRKFSVSFLKLPIGSEPWRLALTVLFAC